MKEHEKEGIRFARTRNGSDNPIAELYLGILEYSPSYGTSSQTGCNLSQSSKSQKIKNMDQYNAYGGGGGGGY